MKTEITELLGIEYPVIQGGMAWVAECHLAAAVSNAGGLGLIAAGGAPAEWVREQIRETKKLTDKPFGVNIMLMNPESEKVAKVIVEEGVKVVTTGAGSPEKYMADWKAAGVKVIPVVASVALAKRMERCGADAVVAEGCEAGGHIGELTTMVLVPQVVDAVKIPVIAAGGIADGRGMAAAFMLGASRRKTFLAVILPELRPALLTGFGLAFARGIGEYGSVIYISGNSAKDKTQVISYVIMQKLGMIDYESATAIALLMLIISFVLLLFINIVQARQSARTNLL